MQITVSGLHLAFCLHVGFIASWWCLTWTSGMRYSRALPGLLIQSFTGPHPCCTLEHWLRGLAHQPHRNLV